jgi:hypothetical protein
VVSVRIILSVMNNRVDPGRREGRGIQFSRAVEKENSRFSFTI